MSVINRIFSALSLVIVFIFSSPPLLSAAEPQIISIKLGSYYIKPDKIVVKVDQSVTLNIVNEATFIPHNLTVKAHEAGMDFKVDVSAGKNASVTFTPTKMGTYEMTCTKKPFFGKSHEEKGMHGTIEVVP
ncbi:MAG: cupredoxin domain-containing protein [Sulfuricaulis sp.]